MQYNGFLRCANFIIFLLAVAIYQGGDSWSALALSESMGEQAICQGSMISVGSALFYSHPFHADGTRTDGWIKFRCCSVIPSFSQLAVFIQLFLSTIFTTAQR